MQIRYIVILFLCLILQIVNLFADAQSVYYMQKSQEYRATTIALYNNAGEQLQNLLEDKSSAFLDQKRAFQKLPSAIILDIDETVLNNSEYPAFLIKNNTFYQPDTWDEFINSQRGTAVAGVVNFIKKAQSLGITVFFVSNRESHLKKSTIGNLIKIGIPSEDLEKRVLLKGEKKEWRSNKFIRYEEIAKNYRIVMIVGDDLNDFFPALDISYEKREVLFNKYQEKFGKRWILIPNPIYGSFLEVIEKSSVKLEDQLTQYKK